MTSVHGVSPLYSALIEVLTQYRSEHEARARTPWLPMPAELDEAIRAINDMDARGVFFRHPTESNSTKSANKPITPEELATWDKDQRGYLKAFVVLDKNDELLEAFHYDPTLLTQELAVLKVLCYWLQCIHVGLRMELAGGW